MNSCRFCNDRDLLTNGLCFPCHYMNTIVYKMGSDILYAEYDHMLDRMDRYNSIGFLTSRSVRFTGNVNQVLSNS